jgi:hypothetical protein
MRFRLSFGHQVGFDYHCVLKKNAEFPGPATRPLVKSGPEVGGVPIVYTLVRAGVCWAKSTQ